MTGRKRGKKSAKPQVRSALLRRNAPKTSRQRGPAPVKETNAARFRRERDEALEQLAATSEVLKAVSNSAGNLGPVFDAMLQNAVRICGAKFGNLMLREGGCRPRRCNARRASSL